MTLRSQPPAYSPLPAGAFAELLRSGRAGAPDPRVRLAALLRGDYSADAVRLFGSGTQALTVALESACEARPGEALVALPAFACPEVAAAAVGAGLRFVLYDLDPATLAPDLDSLERALRLGAGIVVAAPLFGMPLDWDALAALVHAYGAVLAEDAAQGHGATWLGRPLGALAGLSVLSFGRGKGWTGGAGGALLLRTGAGDGTVADLLSARRTRAAADRARSAPVVLRAALQALLGRPSLYGLPRALPFLRLGETRYHDPGPPAAMSRSAAALALGARQVALEEAEARRRNAAELLEGIRAVAGVGVVRPAEGAAPGYLRLPILLPRGMASFEDVSAAMRLGIAPGYPTPLAGWPEVHRHLVDPHARMPGAERLAAALVTLPSHSRVTAAETARILALVRSAVA